MNRRKSIRVILPVMILVAAAGLFFGMHFKVNAETNDGRISEGIYIESLSVGGMTAEEAEEALTSYVEELKKKEFTLEAGEKEITFTASQMGFSVLNENIVSEAMDIGKTGSLLKRYKDLTDLEHGDLVLELEVGIDTAAVAALLNDNLSKLNTEAVDNGLVRENGAFTYIEGTAGVAVNVDASAELIKEYICGDWDREDAVLALDTEITEPRGTKEELAKVKDLLGEYKTNFSSSGSSRVTNIEIATDRINGTILYPGEEFSVNEAILPRDAAHGYAVAASYASGQTVQSYGGGVCQVSTTLYNAVILAELEVTERSNHSMTVSYVPISMDAAIAGDYLDLKFVNNTETPIYLEGYTEGRNLYFKIYGEETRPAGREISFESEILSREDPGTRFVATEEPVGTVRTVQSKHIGYRSQLWKVVKENGVEVSREKFNTSNYRSSIEIVNVGIATDNQELRMNVYNAIGTGDAATIYSALAPATTPADAPADAAAAAN